MGRQADSHYRLTLMVREYFDSQPRGKGSVREGITHNGFLAEAEYLLPEKEALLRKLFETCVKKINRPHEKSGHLNLVYRHYSQIIEGHDGLPVRHDYFQPLGKMNREEGTLHVAERVGFIRRNAQKLVADIQCLNSRLGDGSIEQSYQQMFPFMIPLEDILRIGDSDL